MQRFGENEYSVGKARKRSVDWIIADETATLFLECKAKRLSWGAKVSLDDPKPLDADIDSMAAAVVQVYKTLTDHLNNAYPHFPVSDGRKIFPTIVTLENWRMFGPVMINKLAKAVAAKVNDAGLGTDFVERMPYSIWAIEELEVGLQIMHANGIADFMEGKLMSEEMLHWGCGYMTNRYPKSFPAKKLFANDYDKMFSDVHRAQHVAD
jgi:hypothetical protein